MRPNRTTVEETAILAYELAIYVSVRCDVPESVVEARASQEERSEIIKEELARRSISDPGDRRARSRDVFDAAARRVEALLAAKAA